MTPEPWPRVLDAPASLESTYILEEPVPRENRTYAYVVKGVDADGTRHEMYGSFEQPYDYVPCGHAVLTRGRMYLDPGNIYGDPIFQMCDEGCWLGGGLDFRDIDWSLRLQYIVSGVPVDVYGEVEVSDMLPQVYVHVTEIAPTSSGECGPLPAASTSWGRLKGSYR